PPSFRRRQDALPRRQRAPSAPASMIFTTNTSLTGWGRVLHDEDLAHAIIDRVLERGRLLRLDGPSVRTLKVYRDYINRWRRRFLADGLDGLEGIRGIRALPLGQAWIAVTLRRTESRDCSPEAAGRELPIDRRRSPAAAPAGLHECRGGGYGWWCGG